MLEEIDRFPERVDALENPISELVLPQLGSAYRARLSSLARFRLLAQALTRADPPGDPWLAEYLRVEETGEGERLWLAHEVFDGLEVRVAR